MHHHHRVVQIDLTALPDDPNILQQMLREAVPELQAENEKLWQLIQRLLRHRYGPRSERLDLEQLQLVLEDAEQSAAEDDAAKGAAEPAERRRRIEVAHRNRGALPAHLPRYEVVIDIESKECPCCGGALHLIGDDRTEMLDLVPAQLRVKVVCRPRYGCRSCEGAVVQPLRRSGQSMVAWQRKRWWRTSWLASSVMPCRSTVRHRCSSGRASKTGSFDTERLGGTSVLVADAAL